MNGLKTTKYMNFFSGIGYTLGFGLIIWYSIFGGDNPLTPVIGVIIIFLGRTIGYGIDRIIENKENK